MTTWLFVLHERQSECCIARNFEFYAACNILLLFFTAKLGLTFLYTVCQNSLHLSTILVVTVSCSVLCELQMFFFCIADYSFQVFEGFISQVLAGGSDKARDPSHSGAKVLVFTLLVPC